MKHLAFLIPALVAASAVGAIAYVWFTVARVERRVQAIDGFEGMHFET